MLVPHWLGFRDFLFVPREKDICLVTQIERALMSSSHEGVGLVHRLELDQQRHDDVSEETCLRSI